MKLKNEELFMQFGCCDDFFKTYGIEFKPNDIGRKQFFHKQSKGIDPQEPDPYYLRLMRGKFFFDLVCSDSLRSFKNGEWWGLLQWWKDWKGKRWVLPYILKWRKNLPDWIDKEISREELLNTYGV